jgi:hypothetical protein
MVFLMDPVTSTDPRLARFVFVSLFRAERVGDRLIKVPSQVWWLELDAEGTVIERCGPLTGPALAEGGSLAERPAERLPNVVTGPDGSLRLVYLRRRAAATPGRLDLAVLDLELVSGEGPEAGTLRPRLAAISEQAVPGGGLESPVRTLRRNCLASLPLASKDGRWVYALTIDEEENRDGNINPPARLARIPIGSILAAGAGLGEIDSWAGRERVSRVPMEPGPWTRLAAASRSGR